MAEEKTEVRVTPTPYRRSVVDEIPDDELDEMIEAQRMGVAVVGDSEEEAPEEEDLAPDEETWKKRYGDLRAHQSQREETFKEALASKQKELERAKPEYVLPSSDEELATFAGEYPDLMKIVETVARKQAREEDSGIKARLDALTEKELALDKAEAKRVLKKRHKDIDEIRDSQEFHDWASNQNSTIQSWLYENETDGEKAARAVDLYKIDSGIEQKTKEKPSGPDKKPSAAEAITKSKGKAISTEEPTVWSDKRVASLSTKEFEIHEEEIDQARADGKYLYDLS